MNLQCEIGCVWACGTLLLAAIGCSGAPARISMPAYDPSSIVEEVLELHDTDGDESLSHTELEAVPSLLNSIGQYDADRDEAISRHELLDRLQLWRQGNNALVPFVCTVTLDGHPLPEANVRLVPESFMLDAVKTAEGTTNGAGVATPSVSQEDLPPGQTNLAGLMYPGLYKVEITHSGKTIPSHYNTQTTLGTEVGSGFEMAGVRFELRSR